MVHKPLAASGAVCNPRALTHGEFSASILCKQNDEAQDDDDDDGEDADDDDEFETLDVYDIKHNEKSSAGWIASEDRKSFAVRVQASANRPAVCRAFIDGRRIAEEALDSRFQPHVFIKSAPDNDGELRALCFGEVGVTDDHGLVNEAKVANIGTIRIEILPARRIPLQPQATSEDVGTRTAILPETKVVLHENEKDMRGHHARLGRKLNQAAIRPLASVQLLRDKRPLAVLKFTFRPLAVLQARGTIPTADKHISALPSPSPPCVAMPIPAPRTQELNVEPVEPVASAPSPSHGTNTPARLFPSSPRASSRPLPPHDTAPVVSKRRGVGNGDGATATASTHRTKKVKHGSDAVNRTATVKTEEPHDIVQLGDRLQSIELEHVAAGHGRSAPARLSTVPPSASAKPPPPPPAREAEPVTARKRAIGQDDHAATTLQTKKRKTGSHAVDRARSVKIEAHPDYAELERERQELALKMARVTAQMQALEGAGTHTSIKLEPVYLLPNESKREDLTAD